MGGVKAPDAIVLPDPAKRFATTAARLQVLAIGHPMENWLRFMARLAQAQHIAVTTAAPCPAIDRQIVERATSAQMPPLAADGHRRSPVWRDGLKVLLDQCENTSAPSQALAVIMSLRTMDAEMIEALADAFLHGQIDAGDAGLALYIAAVLQVYFTRMAAALPIASLQLLPQRGLCPSCGSTPSVGLVSASGQTPGVRYLYCSLCATAWNHVRAICITCGDSRSISLEGIEGDAGLVKAETCSACHTYAKMIYQKQDMMADPFADDLAALGLDVLLGETGWSRHAPNPLLLTG
jgi:FdhE protein